MRGVFVRVLHCTDDKELVSTQRERVTTHQLSRNIRKSLTHFFFFRGRNFVLPPIDGFSSRETPVQHNGGRNSAVSNLFLCYFIAFSK